MTECVLHLKGLSKRYGEKLLFENAEANVGPRSRIALVGPNGAGKSTLIKMILGFEHPDHGEISRASHLAIGYLAQEVPKFSGRTVLDEVMRLDGRREELLKTKQELETLFAEKPDSHTPEDLERYGRILEELESLDEYRLESRAKTILTGMGFKPTDWGRSLTEFSGGWLMRVALSRILLMDPDLLLLDEPTNHLDLESLLWLEEFLGNHQGAMILISHDRAFLNRLVTDVLAIDQKKLWNYRGNLDSYEIQKQERLTVLRAQYESQQSKIAEIEAFVDRFGAKATKARQAQSRLKQLEKMERIEMPDDNKTVSFRFPPAPHSGKEVVTVKDAAVNFGPKTVFKDLNWAIQRGSRTAIVGVNGAGKTTLLRMIAMHLAPTKGEAKLGHEVKVGYYAQIQSESLDPKKTILEELEVVAPDMPLSRVRAIAGAFLFSGEAVKKKCGILSGGEKARVALAKLLLSPANFLVLDEPTNHLDAESRSVLLEALQNYTGTLCLVSHDREFMGPLVNSVLEIIPNEGGSAGQGSNVVKLTENYEEYLARKLREAKTQMSPKAAPSSVAQTQAPAPKPARTGPSNNQRQYWMKEKSKIELEITELEKAQSNAREVMAAPETYDNKEKTLEWIEKLRKIESDLGAKLMRWEELSSLLESASS